MFSASQTKDNLMRAFAGESQARNRYTFSAEVAKNQKLYVIEMVFKYTASQEKAHAKVFMDHLQELDGTNLTVDGSYPVETSKDILTLLNNSVHNESEEHDVIYKKFGEIAHNEGFYTVENSFKMIGEIEKTHAERFKLFAELLQNNQLFVNDVKTKWICLNCGFEIESTQAPPMCPVCHHEQGYFIRAELSPWYK